MVHRSRRTSDRFEHHQPSRKQELRKTKMQSTLICLALSTAAAFAPTATPARTGTKLNAGVGVIIQNKGGGHGEIGERRREDPTRRGAGSAAHSCSAAAAATRVGARTRARDRATAHEIARPLVRRGDDASVDARRS